MFKLKKLIEKKESRFFMGEMGQFDRWGMSACVVGKENEH